MSAPKLAVYKFSSCDGCQLSILNLEDELLALAQAVEIAYFLEATSAVSPGPYDVALVEGSISTPHEAERIREIRRQSSFLVALGTCATAGGIQALRNFADVKEFTWAVYQHPEYIETLPSSTPIKDHVKVDLELWGCPVNKYQVVEVVTALLMNRRPLLPTHSVCLDCKRLGYTCVPVAAGIPCMGPLTRSGCGALCPGKERGCYGCFGPVQNGEIEAWIPVLKRMERHPNETLQLLRNFCANAPAFRDAAEALLADGEV